ncbi:MAG: hypothetical protein AAF570_10330 [Bacteroidota bacterium]
MLEATQQVLEDFLIGYGRNPETDFEDTDWRRVLFSALHRHFRSAGATYEMEKNALGVTYYPQRDKVRLTPVKTAYPAAEKFDIAVLDTSAEAERPSAENSPEQPYGVFWAQPLIVAINIHLCKEDQAPSKYFRKLDGDLKKFGKYAESSGQGDRFCGLSILLVKDDVEADERMIEGKKALEKGGQAWIIGENGEFQYQPAT